MTKDCLQLSELMTFLQLVLKPPVDGYDAKL